MLFMHSVIVLVFVFMVVVVFVLVFAFAFAFVFLFCLYFLTRMMTPSWHSYTALIINRGRDSVSGGHELTA